MARIISSRLSTQLRRLSLLAILGFAATGRAAQTDVSAEVRARQLLAEAGVRGGLVVQLGCGDVELTAALGAGDGYLVHGLDSDAAAVDRARERLREIGKYGKVSVEQFDGKHLPYIDNLVNLVVAEDLGDVSMDEVMRVLCPSGVAYLKKGGQVTRSVKPRPADVDEWTHYLHSASNNAVARDEVVGPPRRMQWVGGPRYARHHDHMSSFSAAVTSGGRLFYIFDEASPASILIPPKWTLTARDAFNGTVLWRRPIDQWHTHLWRLKSGPAQLPRRLVAEGDRVYVTLSLDAPLSALDAATGETVRTYDGTRATEEVILQDGLLIALVNDADEKADYDGFKRFRGSYGAKFYDEAPRKIVAIRADSGEVLWRCESRVLPATLAADAQQVVFHDGESVVCLDRATGQQRWRSEPVARAEEIKAFYVPILVLYDGVVLFSGGETAGKQTGSWYREGKDTLTALSADDGEVLWTAHHPPSGYRSPEDLLVAGGLVWTGETTSGRAPGVFTGRDPKTGEVKQEFPPDVDTYWFHHRCYRGKATDNYLLMSRTGVEFIDIERQHWLINHWVRGACLYGVMPANGLLYAPQHPCACYLETKLYGFNALAPAASGGEEKRGQGKQEVVRRERGPAFLTPGAGKEAGGEGRPAGSEDPRRTPVAQQGSKPQPSTFDPQPSDWPTYRRDAARSGRASTPVPAALKPAWKTGLGGKLSAPVIAGGKLFVAAVDEHTVHALDAATGKPQWSYTAGARIDSPPTIHEGRAIFGSADGRVYCLRAEDGALVWRFHAAPADRRLMSFGQLESVWPVPGSVLVEGGTVWCVAGRSVYLDGGLRLYRLDPATGEIVSETVLDDSDPEKEQGHQGYVSWLNMPAGLPDVLSSDGRRVYMRSQAFTLDGKRLPLEAMPSSGNADAGAPAATQDPELAHVFSPTGFLDDSWWHRTYWIFGSRFVSGWCGYFRAGKAAPAGRIMVFDDERVYSFGRKPQFFRWTTPIEHHLFAADKKPTGAADPGARQYLVDVHWAKDLPLLVRAMVLADGKLFVAGPPDLVDEVEALKRIDDPATQAALVEQAESLAGRKGALLWAVSAADGGKRGELALDAPPVFDGMAAAGGRLYLSAEDGSVTCLSGK